LSLVRDITVDDKVPPTFIAQATDDRTDDVRESLAYYRAWRTRARRWKCICSHAAAMRSGCA
jgi:hypothetical protein